MSITCQECGSQNPDDSNICGECGVELLRPAKDAPPSPAKTPTASATVAQVALPRTHAKVPVGSTRLQLTEAFLVHVPTGERFDVIIDTPAFFIGKPNDEFPTDMDITHLPGADIVSRIHALIREENNTFYLEDAGSSNGTFLNGELIKPGARFRKPLKNGDILSLGKGERISFRVEFVD
jgi:ribosomal protein L40E